MAPQDDPLSELFDVVDVRDCVLRQATRAEVHAEGLLHRAVHVLIFNARRELFLQKRSMRKDVHPGVWGTSCAGHLDAGEDYDSAAAREFMEELGSAAPPLERVLRLEACKETGREFVWVYRCLSDGPFRLNSLEINEGRWISVEGLEKEITSSPGAFAPSFIYVWRAYLASLR